jgi:phospholipid transport system substrate-binding protein
MNVSIKKFLIRFCTICLLLFLFTEKSFSLESKEFVQITVDKASLILSKVVDSKEEKILKLKDIAKETVDINGLGFYALGVYRKNLTIEQKKIYLNLFEEYFLITFASRLAEYTDPKINVQSQKKLNKNYTIVSSVLIETDQRPEIKIDWRIYTKNPDKLLIRDLIIEGLSLARTHKEEFNSIIQNNDGDIKALFSNLRQFINKKD